MRIRRTFRIPADVKELIAKEASEGANARDLAVKYNIATGTVYGLCLKRGVKVKMSKKAPGKRGRPKKSSAQVVSAVPIVTQPVETRASITERESALLKIIASLSAEKIDLDTARFLFSQALK